MWLTQQPQQYWRVPLITHPVLAPSISMNGTMLLLPLCACCCMFCGDLYLYLGIINSYTKLYAVNLMFVRPCITDTIMVSLCL